MGDILMGNMLKDQVAIVTGAGRGLGAGFAAALAAEGAAVVVADIRPTEETVAAITAQGGRVCGATGDVQRFDDCRSVVETAVEVFGRVDILVNNAALYGGISISPFDDLDEEEWDRMMSINVKGVWQMTRAAVPAMRTSGYGRIVNISSNVIFMGKPGFLHYVASKGAVWAMTGALSRELAGTGITVNAIAPGYTTTAATRGMGSADTVSRLEESILGSQSVRRLMEPDDLLAAVLFLAGPGSGMVTGQTITVDGGTITG